MSGGGASLGHRPDPTGPTVTTDRTTRVLLLTGKGGVGKTTVAAATAVRAAADGHRVLLTSTDPAHSLADVLGVPLGDAPRAVTGRLDAQQLDAGARLEQHWHRVRDFLVEVLAGTGMERVHAEEVLLLPGLEELFALVRAASEALTFSGIEAGAMDVGFFAPDDPTVAKLAKVGLRFDLPQGEGLQHTPRMPPGSDPSKPPILK